MDFLDDLITTIENHLREIPSQHRFAPLLRTQHTAACPDPITCVVLDPTFPAVRFTPRCMGGGAWFLCPVTVEGHRWIASDWMALRDAAERYLRPHVEGIDILRNAQRVELSPDRIVLATDPWHRDPRMGELGTERLMIEIGRHALRSGPPQPSCILVETNAFLLGLVAAHLLGASVETGFLSVRVSRHEFVRPTEVADCLDGLVHGRAFLERGIASLALLGDTFPSVRPRPAKRGSGEIRRKKP